MLPANKWMFFTTTETTMTTGRMGATLGCHEVTYNCDNKITVVNSFFSQAQGKFSSICQLNRTDLSTRQPAKPFTVRKLRSLRNLNRYTTGEEA